MTSLSRRFPQKWLKKSPRWVINDFVCLIYKNDLVRKYYLENENQSCKIFSSNWELTKKFLLNFSLKLKLFLHNDWKYLANFCSDFFSIKSDTFCFIWGKEMGTYLLYRALDDRWCITPITTCIQLLCHPIGRHRLFYNASPIAHTPLSTPFWLTYNNWNSSSPLREKNR